MISRRARWGVPFGCCVLTTGGAGNRLPGRRRRRPPLGNDRARAGQARRRSGRDDKYAATCRSARRGRRFSAHPDAPPGTDAGSAPELLTDAPVDGPEPRRARRSSTECRRSSSSRSRRLPRLKRPRRRPRGSLPPDPVQRRGVRAPSARPPARLERSDAGRARKPPSRSGAQADFEMRLENPSQQFGIEQIMRFLGAKLRLVASLALITGRIEQGGPHRRPHRRPRRRRDEEQKGRRTSSPWPGPSTPKTWLDKQTIVVQKADRRPEAEGDQEGAAIATQVTKYPGPGADEGLHVDEAPQGAFLVVEYLIQFSADVHNSADRRKTALAAPSKAASTRTTRPTSSASSTSPRTTPRRTMSATRRSIALASCRRNRSSRASTPCSPRRSGRCAGSRRRRSSG